MSHELTPSLHVRPEGTEHSVPAVRAPTPNEITREGGSRRIDVTANVRGRDLGAVALDINAALATVSFQEGYHPEILGEYAVGGRRPERMDVVESAYGTRRRRVVTVRTRGHL